MKLTEAFSTFTSVRRRWVIILFFQERKKEKNPPYIPLTEVDPPPCKMQMISTVDALNYLILDA